MKKQIESSTMVELLDENRYSIEEVEEMKKKLEYFENMEQVRLIEEKFKYVIRELSLFSQDVTSKSFFGLFHKYTKEELMQSPRIIKIFSALDKIRSDLFHWKENGKLTIRGEYSYYIKREEMVARWKDIEQKIHDRKPTFLEKIIEVFADVMIAMLDKIPPITKRLPGWLVRMLPRKVQNAISSMKKYYLSMNTSVPTFFINQCLTICKI